MTTTVSDWIAGARPRTLWTALTPVAVGTACAHAVGAAAVVPALLALGVALGMQVAVNYANDYSDGVRGTDVNRIGPDRLVATGKATPSAVKLAAFIAFGTASLFGIYLTLLTAQWWLLLVGVVAIVAAWTYTGSAKPYGYGGWGEASVFTFFGPVAVVGTMLTQAGAVTWWAFVASAGVGCYAVALLMVNNIRDLDTDALAGKHTLAVRMGPFRSRQLFAAVVLAPVALAVGVSFAHPWALMATVVALPSLLAAIGMRVVKDGAALKPFFGGVSAIGLVYGLLLAIGIAL
ncbi:MAG: 1,4-dihydroxy-2-naphthoate polyprenyltransferase [Actinobacteria bacterium HGW-Actinobacteria-4]|nr:MAG: 1,4-dihydroxy-2-naphthoate polyprenyltransferase [Actinobacteria bacterium HGW-Actinobacteria-4]